MSHVAVLGASGDLGREVARIMVDRGNDVTAFVRRPGSARSVHVQEYVGDAREAEDVQRALAGADAVVDVVGGGTLWRSDLESTAIANVVAAMQLLRIKRLVAMSAGMVVKTNFILDYVLKPSIFRNILAEHRRVEAIVEVTELDWTLVRPPRLVSRAPRGYVVSSGARFSGSLSASRADIAQFIADELMGNKFLRQAVFVSSDSRKGK